jgi:hypothetical protein
MPQTVHRPRGSIWHGILRSRGAIEVRACTPGPASIARLK